MSKTFFIFNYVFVCEVPHNKKCQLDNWQLLWCSIVDALQTSATAVSTDYKHCIQRHNDYPSKESNQNAINNIFIPSLLLSRPRHSVLSASNAGSVLYKWIIVTKLRTQNQMENIQPSIQSQSPESIRSSVGNSRI
jgi:hypothetical protein